MTTAPRLARLRPFELDGDQRAMYDAIVDGPRGGTPGLVDDEGCLGGPLNTLLHAPALGIAQQALGAALHYRVSLPRRVAELAILVVAHHAGSGFERASHEPMAHAEGFTDAQLQALRDRREPRLDDPVERVAWRTAVALVSGGELNDDAYDEAVGALSERGLVELTTLVGYYRLLALQLAVFGVGAEQYGGRRYEPAEAREAERA